MNYAGNPVGLRIFEVAPGATARFAARLERDLMLSRLRWWCNSSGLMLVNAWSGYDSLIAVDPFGSVLGLAKQGCWRFLPAKALVGWEVGVSVHNPTDLPVRPDAIAFWGLPL